MTPLAQADPGIFKSVRFVLTDMDETLTHNGRLFAHTYEALERLQNAGIEVVPVTAAPAGWCDQMARMWPVAGVIAENGGLFLQRDGQKGVQRRYWHGEAERSRVARRLEGLAQHVIRRVPAARLADDQAFRLTSLAFARPACMRDEDAIIAALRDEGADFTANNLWLLAWFGGYDKLKTTRRVMNEAFAVDIEHDIDVVLYAGDSGNDAPMFAFFRHTVGVSTVGKFLHELPVAPAWVTAGPGGVGFVEITDAILRARIGKSRVRR